MQSVISKGRLTKRLELDLTQVRASNLEQNKIGGLIKRDNTVNDSQKQVPKVTLYELGRVASENQLKNTNPSKPLSTTPRTHINMKPTTLVSYNLFKRRYTPGIKVDDVANTLKSSEMHRKNSYDHLNTLISSGSLDPNMRKISTNHIAKRMTYGSYTDRYTDQCVHGSIIASPKLKEDGSPIQSLHFEVGKQEKKSGLQTNASPSQKMQSAGLPQISSKSPTSPSTSYGLSPSSSGKNRYELDVQGISSPITKSKVIQQKKTFIRVLRQDKAKELQKDLSECFKPIVDNTNAKFLLNVDLLYKNNKIFKMK